MQHRQIGTNRARFQENLIFYGDISGLRSNTANSAGTTNASDRITLINNLSRESNNIVTNAHSVTAIVVEDGFAVGESIIECTSTWLDGFQNALDIGPDDEFWFATKIKAATGNHQRVIFSIGGIQGGNTHRQDLVFGINNGSFFIKFTHRDPTTITSRIETADIPAHDDDTTWNNVIFHYKPTLDIANSRIIVNEVELSTTVTNSNSFAGRTLIWSEARIGLEASAAVQSINADFAKVFLVGRGEPNPNIIATYL